MKVRDSAFSLPVLYASPYVFVSETGCFRAEPSQKGPLQAADMVSCFIKKTAMDNVQKVGT
jgi:hypothetical protein